ncbi:MAG: flagellar hook-associated protein 3 [Candidatus Riflebacteria bacterium HGW-Riflebacteria-2]|jgi:flagellin-like hook-associated protein FlgL|nr:MAG: flagellar hook-associated protein 3 [Candidatus Riflebacteria bacterium HGW-Riflebacteria-2]
MRITNQWIINSFVSQVNRNSSSLNEMQTKISSGLKYIRASESPVDNALIMQNKVEINENTQFIRNIDHVNDWYNNTDGALSSIESAVQRVRELAVQGANDTLVQSDRDAIATEINELILHMVDIANTNIGGEYIFAGHKVDSPPFNALTGHDGDFNTDMVTYSLGDTRDDANLNNILSVLYGGSDKRLTSEIERGSVLEKSITGLELFFGDNPVSPTPGFTYTMPPLEESLPLQMMNLGSGVQEGSILVTDQNGVEHKIDLSTAHRLDDVIGMINATRSFEAGIEEVPSDTAVALGINRNAGFSSLLVGLSDPKMLSEFTNLTDLNEGLGVPDGYLNINTRDGKNYRVDISGATTVGDIVSKLNAVNGGAALEAKFDMIHKRIEIEDITGGAGEFAITSTRTQLFIKDLPPHVASDLGIARSVGAGNQIVSTYDPVMESETTPLSLLNDGKGVEPGYLDIFTHDGSNVQVDLTKVQSPLDIITAINEQAVIDGVDVVASFDVDSNRMIITDNTFGPDDFRIEEVYGTDPIAVREVTTLTRNLGLLKSSQGNTIVGNTLISSGPPIDETTLLTDLVPPPERGFMVIRGADKEPVKVDLTGANTIQDVIDGINGTGKFEAAWDATAKRLVVTDPAATGGNFGIVIEELVNTGRDLGFITGTSNHESDVITGAPIHVKSLPTLVGSIDLDPALTPETDLQSLNSTRLSNPGVNLGYIRITDKAGRFAAIDLRGSKTIDDILTKINNPANGIYVEARISADGKGLEIVDKNHGAAGKLEVIDIDSTSASDLGILGRTVDHVLLGKDVDPAVSLTTPVSALNGGAGVPLGKVYVQSGSYSGEIDLTGVKTVGEMLDKLSNTDNNFNLQAWISEDGKRINLTNTMGEPYIKMRDAGGKSPNTASSLGLGNTPSIFTTLMDLRDNLLRNDAKAISEESIKKIDEDLKRVLDLHAEVGSKTNRATAAKEKQETITLNLKNMLSSVENIDMSEAIIKMTEYETSYQAALQVGSRIMQMSLLDFLG